MAIRGSGIQVSSASSYTIPWPAGTLAGDLAIIFVASGYEPVVPTGWTSLYPPVPPSGISGFAASKVLNSSDITAGSVVVSIGGTYDGAAEIVTFVGAPVIRETEGDATSSTRASDSISTSGAVVSGDLAIYFGTERADGATPTATVSRGSSLQSQGDINFCGCIFSEAMTGGSVTPVFSASVSAYLSCAVVIVEGASSLTQTITFPTIPNHVNGDPPFALTATSDSGLTVSYSVTSGPATVSGSTVTITGPGAVTIQASQAGNGTYAAATPVSQTFNVSHAQRGNISYDQIKASDRTGNGDQLLTWNTTVPATSGAAGTPGQIAYDALGNFFWCYATNLWARSGPGGYSTSF